MTTEHEGNVIDITERINVKRYLQGDTRQFMQCPCEGHQGFAPVVDIASQKPLVIALVCTNCGNDFEVINGGIQ